MLFPTSWVWGLKPRIITKRLTQTGKWNEDNWTKRKRIREADLLTLLHVPKTKGRAHRLKATEDWTDYEHALNIKQEKGFTWQELMRTRERHGLIYKNTNTSTIITKWVFTGAITYLDTDTVTYTIIPCEQSKNEELSSGFSIAKQACFGRAPGLSHIETEDKVRSTEFTVRLVELWLSGHWMSDKDVWDSSEIFLSNKGTIRRIQKPLQYGRFSKATLLRAITIWWNCVPSSWAGLLI